MLKAICKKSLTGLITMLTVATMLLSMGFATSNFVLGEEQQVHSPHGDKLYVHHAWLRKPIGTLKTSAAYMMIGNPTKEDDFLLSATSSFSAKTEVHEIVRNGDVMRMKPVPRLRIAPKAYTQFKEGSYHLMITGIHTDLNVGETLMIKLSFEKAGVREVAFKVLASSPRGSHAGDDKTKEHSDHRGSH